MLSESSELSKLSELIELPEFSAPWSSKTGGSAPRAKVCLLKL